MRFTATDFWFLTNYCAGGASPSFGASASAFFFISSSSFELAVVVAGVAGAVFAALASGAVGAGGFGGVWSGAAIGGALAGDGASGSMTVGIAPAGGCSPGAPGGSGWVEPGSGG